MKLRRARMAHPSVVLLLGIVVFGGCRSAALLAFLRCRSSCSGRCSGSGRRGLFRLNLARFRLRHGRNPGRRRHCSRCCDHSRRWTTRSGWHTAGGNRSTCRRGRWTVTVVCVRVRMYLTVVSHRPWWSARWADVAARGWWWRCILLMVRIVSVLAVRLRVPPVRGKVVRCAWRTGMRIARERGSVAGHTRVGLHVRRHMVRRWMRWWLMVRYGHVRRWNLRLGRVGGRWRRGHNRRLMRWRYGRRRGCRCGMGRIPAVDYGVVRAWWWWLSGTGVVYGRGRGNFRFRFRRWGRGNDGCRRWNCCLSGSWSWSGWR